MDVKTELIPNRNPKGAGRKPGIKTKPIRLPLRFLEELESIGDPKTLIVDACQTTYDLEKGKNHGTKYIRKNTY